MSRSRLQISKQDILAYFNEAQEYGNSIYRLRELAAILTDQRGFWRLAKRTTTHDFIDFLIYHASLKKLEFEFPSTKETLYTWGNVPLLSVLLKLKKNAYLSHYTAMRIHGLTEQIPKKVYVNHERKSSTHDDVPLRQWDIDEAFHKAPRVSNNAALFDDYQIILLNGQHTGNAGVVEGKINFDDVEKVSARYTGLERTLIDAVVSPNYSGGVSEVMKAFEEAKDRVSINSLMALLKKLEFKYPYHQAIGFYMQRAMYKEKLLDLVRSVPMKWDFYLTHDMGATDYVSQWKLFVPKGA